MTTDSSTTTIGPSIKLTQQLFAEVKPSAELTKQPTAACVALCCAGSGIDKTMEGQNHGGSIRPQHQTRCTGHLLLFFTVKALCYLCTSQPSGDCALLVSGSGVGNPAKLVFFVLAGLPSVPPVRILGARVKENEAPEDAESRRADGFDLKGFASNEPPTAVVRCLFI